MFLVCYTCSTADLTQDFPIIQQDSCNSRHGSNLAQGTFNLVSFSVLNPISGFILTLHLMDYVVMHLTDHVVTIAADQYFHGAWLAQHAICYAAEWLVGLGCNGSLDVSVLSFWQAHCVRI